MQTGMTIVDDDQPGLAGTPGSTDDAAETREP
jgi:hypothetical protein